MGERREVELSLALHKAAVPHLISDWGRVEPIIRQNLARYRERPRSPLAQSWVDEWQAAVEQGPEAVSEVALTPDERGHDLRQMTPLAGVLTQQERLDIITSLRTRRNFDSTVQQEQTNE